MINSSPDNVFELRCICDVCGKEMAYIGSGGMVPRSFLHRCECGYEVELDQPYPQVEMDEVMGEDF